MTIQFTSIAAKPTVARLCSEGAYALAILLIAKGAA